jgi:hypothetical protein
MPIYDRLKVQLRAETFNVLNHPNFGYIEPSLSDSLFGRSTKMLNQSFGPTGSLPTRWSSLHPILVQGDLLMTSDSSDRPVLSSFVRISS